MGRAYTDECPGIWRRLPVIQKTKNLDRTPMTSFTAKNSSYIAPFNSPFIAPDFTAITQTRLLTKRNDAKSAVDPTFVRDEDGNIVFTSKPHTPTLTNRHILSDKNGEIEKDIGQYRVKRSSLLRDTYYVGTMKEERRFKLSLKVKNPSDFQADILFKDKNIGKVKGDWVNLLYSVAINGNAIASILPVFSNNEGSSIGNGYYTVIEEGVDVVFVVLVTLALEQIFHGHIKVCAAQATTSNA